MLSAFLQFSLPLNLKAQSETKDKGRNLRQERINDLLSTFELQVETNFHKKNAMSVKNICQSFSIKEYQTGCLLYFINNDENLNFSELERVYIPLVTPSNNLPHFADDTRSKILGKLIDSQTNKKNAESSLNQYVEEINNEK